MIILIEKKKWNEKDPIYCMQSNVIYSKFTINFSTSKHEKTQNTENKSTITTIHYPMAPIAANIQFKFSNE